MQRLGHKRSQRLNWVSGHLVQPDNMFHIRADEVNTAVSSLKDRVSAHRDGACALSVRFEGPGRRDPTELVQFSERIHDVYMQA